MKHIPNIITFGRIACVPLLVMVLWREDFRAALYLALLMGVSDALDGFLAKRCRWRSWLGERLDPLADKLMLTAAYLMFAVQGLLPVWLVALVVVRDALIVAGYAYYRWFNLDFDVRPSTVSKLNTLCQLLLVFAVLIAQLELELAELVTVLTGVVAVTTVVSGGGYALAARSLSVRRGVSRTV